MTHALEPVEREPDRPIEDEPVGIDNGEEVVDGEQPEPEQGH